ncbi:hypothetical protein TRFO_35346 [Tritrichomonas foetus]|uniref:Uncharacterized protein n=1 Tax=Tritrichomonas foetus TaxID=1144522 RepID=A0A1J4JIU7_9EUKA|nr:hypothetical protein TRFO_35346 [Tritrichomonas foetus]|eukprot:OHS98279.1 hypothetical protein TRFO_35346 [Tritrichomonas foetus]
MEELVIVLEKNGNRVLPAILANHRDFIYDSFTSKMFYSNPDVSLFYYLAVGYLYFIPDDRSYAEKLGFNINSNALMCVSSDIFNAHHSFISRHFSELACQPNNGILSENDIKINKELMTYAPKIIIASFMYLLHDDFFIQRTAFQILVRIVPVLLTIINPNDQHYIADVMHVFNEIAPVFNSGLSTITPETVQDVCSIFAISIPFFTDLLLKEAFNIIKGSKIGSFMSYSTSGLLIYVLKPLFKNISIACMNSSKSSWPKEFILFNPFMFMDELIQISHFIEPRDMTSFLSIWDELAIQKHNESFNLIVNYLLDYNTKSKVFGNRNNNEQNNKRDNNVNNVKMILMRLAKLDIHRLIDLLTSRFSFAFWFKSTLQDNMNSNEPPRKPEIQEFETIILTLSELIKPYFSLFVPKLHLILNFVLLYYDPSIYFLSDLLLLILSILQDCPSKLRRTLSPPSSLVWPSNLQINFDIHREFTSIDISLAPFSKKSVVISKFLNDLIDYFNSNDKFNDIIQNWGKEIICWVCGCGDLLISSRASYLFSELLSPLSPNSIESLIKSFVVILRSEQNKSTTFYLVSMMNLFSKILDAFKYNDEYRNVFSIIVKIAISFLDNTSSFELCEASLQIISKYINYFYKNECDEYSSSLLETYQQIDNELTDKNEEVNETKNDEILDIDDILYKIASLSGVLPNRYQIYGVILSIIKREIDVCNSSLAKTSFICFLPFVYSALCAFHNIQPFSNEMKNSEIQRIFQCLPLISTGLFVTLELRFLLNNLFSDPALIDPDEFILQACSKVTDLQNDFILDVAPYLYRIAESSRSISLLSAVFSIVGSFFKAMKLSSSDSAIFEQYYPIIILATKHFTSIQAKELIQSFLQKISATTSDSNITYINSATENNTSLIMSKKIHTSSAIFNIPPTNVITFENVVEKVNVITSKIKMKFKKVKNNMLNPIIMIPLDSWNSKTVVELRQSLQNLHVCEKWAFVNDKKVIETLLSMTIYFDPLLKFEPPVDSRIYSAYLSADIDSLEQEYITNAENTDKNENDTNENDTNENDANEIDTNEIDKNENAKNEIDKNENDQTENGINEIDKNENDQTENGINENDQTENDVKPEKNGESKKKEKMANNEKKKKETKFKHFEKKKKDEKVKSVPHNKTVEENLARDDEDSDEEHLFESLY